MPQSDLANEPYCPTLPSARSAQDLLDGRPGAAGRVVLHTLARSALTAPGIYAAGVRDWKQLALAALGAGLSIELFVFAWRGWESYQHAQAQAAAAAAPAGRR